MQLFFQILSNLHLDLVNFLDVMRDQKSHGVEEVSIMTAITDTIA